MNIIFENCTIDNSNTPDGTYLFNGNFQYTDATTFKFVVKNCTFKNGTTIAGDGALNNKSIVWELDNNTFE